MTCDKRHNYTTNEEQGEEGGRGRNAFTKFRITHPSIKGRKTKLPAPTTLPSFHSVLFVIIIIISIVVDVVVVVVFVGGVLFYF